jgi:hypothetical protein
LAANLREPTAVSIEESDRSREAPSRRAGEQVLLNVAMANASAVPTKGQLDASATVRLSLGRYGWRRELLGNSGVLPRFGTEGSEVQILSLRPILINKIGLPSTVIVG